jgi:CRP-like cAMP-binding protein
VSRRLVHRLGPLLRGLLRINVLRAVLVPGHQCNAYAPISYPITSSGGPFASTIPTVIEQHLARLRQRIAAVVDLPDSEWEHAARRCELRRFERGALLARADAVMTHSFHVVAGLVRLYYTSADGREHNKGFAAEGRLVGSAASKILGQSAGFDIQALEPTTVLAMPFAVADELLDRHPAWERLRRLALERLYLEKEQREREFLLCDATERYQLFLQREPGLASRLPLLHVASYIGVTPVALSRIRRRLNPG